MSKNMKRNVRKENSKGNGLKPDKVVQWNSSKGRKSGKNTNSPDWYYPSPEIQKLAAAVNMNFRNGNKVNFADGLNLLESSIAVSHMPGVYANPIMHVPGRSTSPTDPVNEASRSMMNRIREQINANRDYEMPDLVKYVMAVSDLFAWIEFLKTIYRVCNKFNTLNRYTPTALLRAMHVDTSDVNNLRIQLKFYLETLAQRVSNLKLPTEIRFVLAWIEDFKNVYVDEDIAKAQYIVNYPQYIWKYTIDEDTSLSKLVPSDYAKVFTFANPADVNDLKSFTEGLLVEILNDEDFAIITGDLMKSYSSFYEVNLSELDSPIEFQYSKEFLEKWHNSCQLNSYAIRTCEGWEITEDTTTYLDPFIKFNPIIKCANAAQLLADRRGGANRFIDFYDREVTNDQIINACLWMFRVINIDSTNNTYEIDSIGTTLVGIGEVVYYNEQEQLIANNYQGSIYFDENTANQFTTSRFDAASSIVQLSKWNYHPLTILLIQTSTSADHVGYFGVIGDFGNYTILDPRIMENVKVCVLYGQFNVKSLLQ